VLLHIIERVEAGVIVRHGSTVERKTVRRKWRAESGEGRAKEGQEGEERLDVGGMGRGGERMGRLAYYHSFLVG
jgi:hypothetical protein